ncbi:MAG: hypothetical protein ACETWK_00835 [Candidatus Aminicenantaceae bacterium]
MSRRRHFCLLLALFLGLLQLCSAQQGKSDSTIPNWTLGVGGGWFGVPKEIMDRLVYKSPSLDGISYAIKLGYEKNPGNIISIVYLFSFVCEEMSGSGIWQYRSTSDSIKGNIDFTQYSTTATLLFNFFDFSPVNPYLGIGLGIGKIDVWVRGQLVKNIEVAEQDKIGLFVPVFCLPSGLRFKIKNSFNIKIEAGFQNGFYACGYLSLYF